MSDADVDLHLVEVEEFIVEELDKAVVALREAITREGDFEQALVALMQDCDRLFWAHDAAVEGANAARLERSRGEEADEN